MLTALAPALLQGGLSLMSGIGARNSAAKQGRLQMMEDARVDMLNQDRMTAINQQRERLGRELLTVEERQATTNYQEDTEDNESESFSNTEGYVNVAAMMAGAEAAGFNPASWLAAGALSAYSGSNTTSRSRSSSRRTSYNSQTLTRSGHNAAAAYKMMMPDMYATNATQIPKVPDMLEVIGNAGTAGLNTFNQLTKQSAQQNQQNDIMRALSGLVSGGARSSSGGGGNVGIIPGLMGSIAGVQSAGTGAPTTSGGVASGVGSLALNPPNYFGAYSEFKSEDDKNKFLNPYGPGTFIDRTVPNAEGWAGRLGEPGEYPGAVRVGARDAYTNIYNGNRTMDADIKAQNDRFGGPAWYAYPLAAGLAGVHYFRPSLTQGVSVNWPQPSYNYDAWTPRASSSSAP